MATKVSREQIVDYITWVERRPAEFPAVFETKAVRRIGVGGYLTFLFENNQTIRYQVQEMMRVEHIVREADILHELQTYNELLGGPGELGCTLMIEIPTAEERDVLLVKWLGLPSHVYLTVGDGTKIRPSFDARQVGDTRLSSVQYLKFNTGGRPPVAIGVDHAALTAEMTLTQQQRNALASDLGR